MRPLSMTLRGLTSLTKVDLDLSRLPPGAFVAVVGPNGAGKSTLLAALSGIAPLHRILPDRKITEKPGPLRTHARGRDAYVENRFAFAGSEWTARVSMDTEYSAGIGKEEGLLMRDGAPIAGPGLKEYDEAVGSLLPPRDVMLAAVFGAQTGTGAFHEMSDPQRRALFAGMLGFEHYDRMSSAARARRLDSDAAAKAVEATLAAARYRAEGGDEARAEAKRLSYAVKSAQRAVDAALRDLEAALAAPTIDEIESEITEALALEHRAIATQCERAADLKRLDDEAATLAAASSTLQRRLLNDAEREIIKRVIASVDERAARLTVASAEAELEEARRVEQSCVKTEDEAKVRLAAARRRHEAAQRDAGRIAGLREILKRREAELAAWVGPDLADEEIAALRARASGTVLQEAEGDLQRLSVVAEQAERVERDLKHALRVNERQSATAADSATRLLSVPCKGERAVTESTAEIVDCAKCPLISQAVDARDAQEGLAAEAQDLREKILIAQSEATAARAACDQARAKVMNLRADLAAVEGELRLLDDKAQRARAVAEARSALEDACELHDGETEAVVQLHEDEATAAARAMQTARYRIQDAQSVLETVKNDAERRAVAQQRLQQHDDTAQELDHVERRRMEVYTEAERIRCALLPVAEEKVTTTRAAVEELVARRAKRQAEIDAARAVERTAQEELHRAQSAVALAEANAARITQAEEEVSAIRDQLVQHQTLAARYGRLESDLGPKGLQARLIGEAGPGVEQIVNALLSEVFGGRFAVELVTQTGGEKGKVLKEEITLRVLGTEGRWRDLSTFSGGEKVLISEAVKLGLALWSCRQNSAPGRSFGALYRDEADGALSIENAELYPMMLRKALVLGGFDCVFMVSHRQAVIDQADALIVVEGGTARLEM